MTPLKSSKPATVGTEYSQRKDLKASCIKMIDILKEWMNKSLKEILENTNNERKLIKLSKS